MSIWPLIRHIRPVASPLAQDEFWSHIDAPPLPNRLQRMQTCFRLPCSQIAVPPLPKRLQRLHTALCLPCSQICEPPLPNRLQRMHARFCLPCSHRVAGRAVDLLANRPVDLPIMRNDFGGLSTVLSDRTLRASPSIDNHEARKTN